MGLLVHEDGLRTQHSGCLFLFLYASHFRGAAVIWSWKPVVCIIFVHACRDATHNHYAVNFATLFALLKAGLTMPFARVVDCHTLCKHALLLLLLTKQANAFCL
jgi:putative component of membrane protein insertase Oxa1/YidC/SpoIIIJ protein YidD